MTSLEKAIWRTVAYQRVFTRDLPSTIFFERLISPQTFSQSEISQALRKSTISLSTQKKLSQQTLKNINDLVSVFRRIPWIQSIWITGSVAAGSPANADDLDIMIVTANNHLWLTRFFCVVFSKILRKYRSYGEKPENASGRWCLNLWLEEQAFALPAAQQNLYTAREIIQAVPVFSRNNFATQKFLKHNLWVKDFTFQGYHSALCRIQNIHSTPTYFLSFSWLNETFYFLQKQYMSKHKTREIVQKDRAFFHPRDTQGNVLQRYEKICAELGVSPYDVIKSRPNTRKA